MIIEVYRGLGTRQGTPVIEPLLSDEVLIQRGIAEMDVHAQAFNRVDMAVVFRPGLRLGQLIEASDPSSATPYRAKITGISISVIEALIEANLTLEQPR